MYADIFSETEQNNIPLVSFKQENQYILITGVKNGPVHTATATVVMIDKMTGTALHNLTINDGGDGELNMGDSFSIQNITSGVYSIELIYHKKIVGTCQFNYYK